MKKTYIISILFFLAGIVFGTDLLAQAAPIAAKNSQMLGILSLVALVIAVVISCFSERNVGIMCIAFGFIIAMLPGSALKVGDLAKFFPLKLFMILVGATLLFSMATINGTVEKLAKWGGKRITRHCGNAADYFFRLVGCPCFHRGRGISQPSSCWRLSVWPSAAPHGSALSS